jgi:hypothetical protein
MICSLLFFLFFLGFLTFLIDVSVNVGVSVSSRDISNIGQGLFKICIIGGGGDSYFNFFNSEWVKKL